MNITWATHTPVWHIRSVLLEYSIFHFVTNCLMLPPASPAIKRRTILNLMCCFPGQKVKVYLIICAGIIQICQNTGLWKNGQSPMKQVRILFTIFTGINFWQSFINIHKCNKYLRTFFHYCSESVSNWPVFRQSVRVQKNQGHTSYYASDHELYHSGVLLALGLLQDDSRKAQLLKIWCVLWS